VLKNLYSLYENSKRPAPDNRKGEQTPVRLSVIPRLDWDAMTASQRLKLFSKEKAILISDNNYPPPEFSKLEMLKVTPSLARPVVVQGDSCCHLLILCACS
jgi:hypothetical protein